MDGALVLEFLLGYNPKRKQKQWQSKGVEGGTEILYVPKFGSKLPATDGERWECQPVDYIFVSSDSKRAIVGVNLLRIVNGRRMRHQERRAAAR